MSREVKMRLQRTKEGPSFRISLYDECGRAILAVREPELTACVAEELAEFLRTGRRGAMTQRAVKICG